MSILKKFMTAVIAPVVGVTAIAVPVAEAKETTIGIQFTCDIKTAGLGSFASQADGPQKKDGFVFNFTVDAPDAVRPGQEFDYTLKGGFVGLGNPFNVGPATVKLTTVEQARLLVNLPDNIDFLDVNQSGGQDDVTVERLEATNQLRIGGDADTDKIDASKSDQINLAKDGEKRGMVGRNQGGKIGFDLPTIKVRARAKEKGKIQPTTPLVADPGKAGYPAKDSFVTLIAAVEAKAPIVGTLNARALVRCTPSDFKGFPAVAVEDGGDPASVKNIAITAEPQTGFQEETSQFTFLATDADGKPVPLIDMETVIAGERQVLTTDRQGVVVRRFTPVQSGQIEVSASVGDVKSAPFNYQVDAPFGVETATAQTAFSCYLTADKEGAALGRHVDGLHGSIAGAKTNPDFKLAVETEYPKNGRVGAPLRYVIRNVNFDFKSVHNNTTAVKTTYNDVSRARLALDFPQGVQIEGNALNDSRAIVSGGLDTDSIDPTNRAQIKSEADGGATGTVVGERVVGSIGRSVFVVTPNAEGEMRPTFPVAADINANQAVDSFFTFNTRINFFQAGFFSDSDDVHQVMARCAPDAGAEQLPAVNVLPAIGNVTVEGPDSLKVGDDTGEYTVTVTDKNNAVAANEAVEVRIGNEIVKGRTNDEGKYIFKFQPKEAGQVAIVAQAGGKESAPKLLDVKGEKGGTGGSSSSSSSDFSGKTIWQILSGIFTVGILGILGWLGLVNSGVLPIRF
ncbi:MAG: Ig-like domain-containing protein [Corynebacterium sp.]|uniref:Ig-like domain-containing protein n=1 Tax=Corynebacterium sp. TaxID=1720 RepID=UPI0026DD5A76|nr:Ig-like domain-containing protein [Corynebacterium sp.]MDO5099461.1 Ig-like domain-containing protein [Corynebacterium sp.]